MTQQEELQQIIEIALNNFMGKPEDKPDFLAKAILDAGYSKHSGVKPIQLQWEDWDEIDYIAETEIGRFWIYLDESNVWIAHLKTVEIGTYTTLEAAQAAAQAHFNETISKRVEPINKD